MTVFTCTLCMYLQTRFPSMGAGTAFRYRYLFLRIPAPDETPYRTVVVCAQSADGKQLFICRFSVAAIPATQQVSSNYFHLEAYSTERTAHQKLTPWTWHREKVFGRSREGRPKPHRPETDSARSPAVLLSSKFSRITLPHPDSSQHVVHLCNRCVQVLFYVCEQTRREEGGGICGIQKLHVEQHQVTILLWNNAKARIPNDEGVKCSTSRPYLYETFKGRLSTGLAVLRHGTSISFHARLNRRMRWAQIAFSRGRHF